jgi:hypothetical protein
MNWQSLKAKVSSTDNNAKPSKKRQLNKLSAFEKTAKVDISDDWKSERISPKIKANYVGLDCEMVGIGIGGKVSALARCCLVDFQGEVIYDEFVRPPGFVTDFRTKWSGVRKGDLRQDSAVTLREVS